MNNKVAIAVSFILGLAAGILLSKKYFEDRYNDIANEEIERALFRKEAPTPSDIDISTTTTNKQVNRDLYTELLKKTKYSGNLVAPHMPTIDTGLADRIHISPYTVTPDDFATLDGYDTMSFTYYADKVLTDDMDNPIQDVDGMVGKENLETFGEYEEDAVYIRNERIRADIEILQDERLYSEVLEAIAERRRNIEESDG